MDSSDRSYWTHATWSLGTPYTVPVNPEPAPVITDVKIAIMAGNMI